MTIVNYNTVFKAFKDKDVEEFLNSDNAKFLLVRIMICIVKSGYRITSNLRVNVKKSMLRGVGTGWHFYISPRGMGIVKCIYCIGC